MKYIIALVALTTFTAFRYVGGFYSQPLQNIDGQSIDLSAYRGKTILFVVLPLSVADTSITPAELTALEVAQPDSLVVIGIPAEEFGYRDSIKVELKNMYGGQHPNFILAQGIKVKKSSGENQSPVFQWLTEINKNKFFNKDVLETGQKFFVNGHGHLYAVVGAHVKLSNPLIGRMISRQPAH